MNKTIRVVVTIVAFFVAVFFLGLLSMAFGSDRGAIYGLLSTAIIGGIPYLVWWATGRMNSVKPSQATNSQIQPVSVGYVHSYQRLLLVVVIAVFIVMFVYPPFQVIGNNGVEIIGVGVKLNA